MKPDDCIFCKIAAKAIPSNVVYDDSHVLGFRDINPQAPTHVLIIPKQHIATLNDISAANSHVVGQLYLAAKAVAEKEGLAQRGYRTVINCNQDAGQTVFHVHLHLLGGRSLGWPPG